MYAILIQDKLYLSQDGLFTSDINYAKVFTSKEIAESEILQAHLNNIKVIKVARITHSIDNYYGEF